MLRPGPLVEVAEAVEDVVSRGIRREGRLRRGSPHARGHDRPVWLFVRVTGTGVSRVARIAVSGPCRRRLRFVGRRGSFLFLFLLRLRLGVGTVHVVGRGHAGWTTIATVLCWTGC